MARPELRKFTEIEKDHIYDALFSVIDKLGNQSKLAEILNISQAQVHYYLYSTCRLRVDHCQLIYEKFGIEKEILRPDLFGGSK